MSNNAFQDFLNGLEIHHSGISCDVIHPVVVQILESLPQNNIFIHANETLSPEANQAAACMAQEFLGEICSEFKAIYPLGANSDLERMANAKFVLSAEELERIVITNTVLASIVQQRLAEQFNT